MLTIEVGELGEVLSDDAVVALELSEETPTPATCYNHKFVKHYGLISKPLSQLLTKKGFYWNEQATQAFLALKQAMLQTAVLALPDFTVPIITVETDACDTRSGCSVDAE